MESTKQRIERSRQDARAQEAAEQDAMHTVAAAVEAHRQHVGAVNSAISRTLSSLAFDNPEALRYTQSAQPDGATRYKLMWIAEGPERTLVVDVAPRAAWVRWGWGQQGGTDQVPPEQMTAAELDRLVKLLTDHEEWQGGGDVPESERRAQAP